MSVLVFQFSANETTQFFEGDENFSWRVLGVESLVIMLSVLLGFTLNGWRESQSEQETVEAALRSIAAEVLKLLLRKYNGGVVEVQSTDSTRAAL